jgi:hypothetical protein
MTYPDTFSQPPYPADPPAADPAPPKRRLSGASLLLAAASLILGVAIGAGGLELAQHPPSFGGNSAAADQKEILAACHKSVEGRLTSPGSARYSQESVVDKTGTQEKAVSGTVDSQNGFGALIRGAYSCTVEKTQAGIWVVDAYEVHQAS